MALRSAHSAPAASASRAAAALAALVAVVALAAPPALGAAGEDPRLAAEMERTPIGAGVARVGGVAVRFDHVHYWAPYSFADRAGLAALLRTGEDAAPVADATRFSFSRHRSYPVHGWSDGAPRAEMTLWLGNDDRGVARGEVEIVGAGAPCRARVEGRGAGAAYFVGACAGDARAVEIVYQAWQSFTDFQLSRLDRLRLGGYAPDFDALAAHCAQVRPPAAAPYCGREALERLVAYGGSWQKREPHVASWTVAARGGALLAVSWAEGDVLYALDRLPAPGRGLSAAAVVFVLRGETGGDRIAGRRGETLRFDFDGAVFTLRGAAGERRVVPDQLVVSGLWRRAIARADRP